MGAVRGAVRGARPGGAQPGGCDLGPTCGRMVRGRPDAWPDGPKSTGRVAGWCEAGRMGCRARSEAGPPPLPRLPRCKAETPTLARLVCRRLCGSCYARSETGSIAGALPTCGVLSVCFPLTDPSRARSPLDRPIFKAANLGRIPRGRGALTWARNLVKAAGRIPHGRRALACMDSMSFRPDDGSLAGAEPSRGRGTSSRPLAGSLAGAEPSNARYLRRGQDISPFNHSPFST